MSKVLFVRHNGIGDLCMMLPFMRAAMDAGHGIEVETMEQNHRWLEYAMGVACSRLRVHPYGDKRKSVPGFDLVFNMNDVPENHDKLVAAGKAGPKSQQRLMVELAERVGLPVPPSLSPLRAVRWCSSAVPKDVLVFTKSTSKSREVPDQDMLEAMKMCLSRAKVGSVISEHVYLNPRYATRKLLAEAISGALLVIGTDSGAIHLAEAFGVRWICYHSTMSGSVRHDGYELGIDVQCHLPCSPCYNHQGCSDLRCVNEVITSFCKYIKSCPKDLR
jgi:hypothetical protein